VDAVWSRASTGELPLLEKLIHHGTFRPGMLVLADRYFSGYPQVSRVAATGAHLIFRSQQYRHHPVLQQLPDGSYLSVLPAADQPTRSERLRAKAEGRRAPRRGLRARQAAGMPIRVVEAEVTVIPDKGSPRTEAYQLITTILNPIEATAEQIAHLYAERWESETGYADLKTYLRAGQSVLRSKDPAGVAQEIYALLIVYQLVQITRAKAAHDHPGLDLRDPDRISFTVTLRALVRTIGEEPDIDDLFNAVLQEIWHQPIITRRARTKPRERKGTAAFARAIEQNPPSTAQYKITIRQPDVDPP
jgi:DDE family transposase